MPVTDRGSSGGSGRCLSQSRGRPRTAPSRGPLRAGAPHLLEPVRLGHISCCRCRCQIRRHLSSSPHHTVGRGVAGLEPLAALTGRGDWGPAPSHPRPAAQGSRSALQRRRQHGVSGTRLPAISPRELRLGPGARVHTPMATPMAFIKLRGTVGFSQSLLSTLTGKKILEKNLRPRRRSEIKVDHKTQGKG